MTELFLYILAAGLAGSLVTLLLFALHPVLRRMPGRWQRRAFQLAALCFVLPFGLLAGAGGRAVSSLQPLAPSTPAPYHTQLEDTLWQALPLAPAYRAGEALGQAAHTPNETSPAPQTPDAQTLAPDGQTAATPEETSLLPTVTPSSGIAAPQLLRLCVLAYGLGLAVSLFVFVVRYLRFAASVRRSLTSATPAQQAVLQTAAAEISLSRIPRLAVSSTVSSPFLFGLLRPCIVLPPNTSSPALRYVLLHELTHYRHRDVACKLFLQCIAVLHWFNPFVYQLRTHFADACEMACDEAVTDTFSDTERRRYADHLLQFAERQLTPAAVRFSAGGRRFKKRLEHLLHPQRQPRRLRVAAAFALCVVLGLALFAGCSMAAGTANGRALPSPGQALRWPTAEGQGVTIGWGNNHPYVEVSIRSGGYVMAIGDGLVTAVGQDESGFFYTEIDLGKNFSVRYEHLSKTFSKEGDSVKAGHILGHVNPGSTAYNSFVLFKLSLTYKGEPVDPMLYLQVAPNPYGANYLYTSDNRNLLLQFPYPELAQDYSEDFVQQAAGKYTVAMLPGKVAAVDTAAGTVTLEHEDGFVSQYNYLRDIEVAVGEDVTMARILGRLAPQGNLHQATDCFTLTHQGKKMASFYLFFPDFYYGHLAYSPEGTVEFQVIVVTPDAQISYPKGYFPVLNAYDMSTVGQTMTYTSPSGSTVISSWAGVIDAVEDLPEGGQSVTLNAGDGLLVTYAPLEATVQPGMVVAENQVLGQLLGEGDVVTGTVDITVHNQPVPANAFFYHITSGAPFAGPIANQIAWKNLAPGTPVQCTHFGTVETIVHDAKTDTYIVTIRTSNGFLEFHNLVNLTVQEGDQILGGEYFGRVPANGQYSYRYDSSSFIVIPVTTAAAHRF